MPSRASSPLHGWRLSACSLMELGSIRGIPRTSGKAAEHEVQRSNPSVTSTHQRRSSANSPPSGREGWRAYCKGNAAKSAGGVAPDPLQSGQRVSGCGGEDRKAEVSLAMGTGHQVQQAMVQTTSLLPLSEMPSGLIPSFSTISRQSHFTRSYSSIELMCTPSGRG